MLDETATRGGAPPARWRPAAQALAGGLLLYGAAGVVCNLRLPALVGAAAATLAGRISFRDTPPDPPGIDLLTAHYAARPWLPWACWLAGLALLALLRPRPAPPPPAPLPEAAPARPGEGPSRRMGALAAGVLLALLLLGAYARLNVLLPQARGLTQSPYDDEGVYAGAGQLVMQGILPYRDFFFAHPPLAALVYLPALAYHFTAWGSVTSFMLARYLSVAYSLAALGALFAVGWLLGRAGAPGGAARWRPLCFGATAAGLWAVDERAIEINRKIMLDQPMILASLLALGCYLLFLERGARRSGSPWLLLAAGALAAISAYTKIQGLTCMAALGLDLLLRVRRRPAAGPGTARPGDLLALAGGFAVVTLLVLGPFLLLAAAPFVRMVGFFQLLRPSDGLRFPAERIANLTATLENGPTAYLAALGAAALTWWQIARAGGEERPPGGATAREGAATGAWRPILIWSFLSVLLFTYSRSFYGHYYVQLGAALCLLAPAVWLPLLPALPGRVPRLAAAATAVLFLPALVLLAPAWAGFTTRSDDTVFAVVGRYVNDAVPPGTPVLSTDEQFNFLASRPPSRNATGYLVDSYGHMIYLGLDLDRRSWGDLLQAVLASAPIDNPYTVMWQAGPQADFLDRAQHAGLVVIHDRGIPRLLETTRTAVLQQDTLRVQQPAGCRSDAPPTRGGCRYLILAPRLAR